MPVPTHDELPTWKRSASALLLEALLHGREPRGIKPRGLERAHDDERMIRGAVNA